MSQNSFETFCVIHGGGLGTLRVEPEPWQPENPCGPSLWPLKEDKRSDLQHPAMAAGGMSPPGLLGLLPCCLALLWGQKVGGLWQPVAPSCGPYKKINDQIFSIAPWLLEA